MLIEKVKATLNRGLPTALFEVFLIFIGITLALAFNNWNSERQELELEREYLLSIHSNLLSNFKQLDSNLEHNTKILVSAAINVREFILKKPFDSDKLIDDINKAGGYRTLSITKSGYTSLRSYGLHIVQSAKLRDAIIELYDRHLERLTNVREGLMVRKQAPELYVPIKYEYGDYTVKFESPEEIRAFLDQRIPLRNMYINVANNYENLIISSLFYLYQIDKLLSLLEKSLDIQSSAQERSAVTTKWELRKERNWSVLYPKHSLSKEAQ